MKTDKDKLTERAAAKTEPALKSELSQARSLSDTAAIFITNALGSIKFLGASVIFLVVWVIWNLRLISFLKPFDPYPFPALEMFVSIFAIILSISVLISQNRQGRMEKLRQQVEFEVNVHAESEITKILKMLHDIQKKIGINGEDAELDEMKENLDIKQLHQKLDEHQEQKDH